jgi:hypothetical protein
MTAEHLVLCAVDNPRRVVKVDLLARANAARLVRENESAIRGVAARLLDADG